MNLGILVTDGLVAAALVAGCAAEERIMTEDRTASAKREVATFAAGCFWCTEAVFERVEGVLSVTSGYTGGNVPNPTYEQVCTGRTGHAEATQIEFDPALVTFSELLDMFWQMHDPTTKDRQGADVGTQYRSAVFYHSEEQKRLAEESRRRLDESGKYPAPAVTEIVPAVAFYSAEGYHQDYYRNNSSAGYCRLVIHPKLKKLRLE